MKNFLLGTTAIAVMAVASTASFAQSAPAPSGFTTASGFSVTIGGFARQFVTSTSQDNTPANVRKGIDQSTDNRLILTFRAPLSFGGTAGAVWQLNPNANTATGNSITRRQWTFLETQFGQIQLGGADNVAAQAFVGSFEAFTGGLVVGDQNIANWTTSKIGTSVVSQGNNHPTTGQDVDGIANKIVYFTPRIEGFQLGVNYTPEQSYRQGLAALGTQYTDGVAATLNYANTLGGVAIRAQAGYLSWKKVSGVNNAQAAAFEDPTQYSFGLGFQYMGFDLGGSYMRAKNFRNITNGTVTTAAALPATLRTVDGRAFELGLGYIFGPAAVSINYVNGDNDDATVAANGIKTAQVNGKDKQELLGVSGRYLLGPGVNVNVGAFTAKYTEGSATSAGFNAAKRDSRANVIATGLTLAF